MSMTRAVATSIHAVSPELIIYASFVMSGLPDSNVDATFLQFYNILIIIIMFWNMGLHEIQ
jgi:hypothetical protein